MKIRVCDRAENYLRANGLDSVAWGDLDTLHAIAGLCGWEQHGPSTTKRVINALAKTPGNLFKMRLRAHDSLGRDRSVSLFVLPEAKQAYGVID